MNDMELVYIAAFRYALGRMTYIVGVVSEQLKKANLSKETKELIIREIGEREHSLGMNIDKDCWLNLKRKLISDLTQVPNDQKAR